MSTPQPSGLRQNPPRKSSQKSLSSIQEDFEDTHILDNLSDEHEPPSPGYDPGANRKAKRTSKNEATPESRKKTGSSTGSKQKQSARAADPNKGRCLLTNLAEAVQTCHLVAGATTSKAIMQFEYAWGRRRGSLHLDTRHNLFFLRADWHRLFDRGCWMLIPDLSVLQKLYRVTVDEAPKDRSQINLNKTFTRRRFKYHLLPIPGLEGPICQFKNPNNLREHSTHYYPFATLGPLVSHIKPQYVVVNAAQKLSHILLSQLPQLHLLLQQVSHTEKSAAAATIQLILDLYYHWTSLAIPDDYATGDNGLGDEDHPSSNQAPSAASDEEQSDGDKETDDSGESLTPSKSKQERQYHDDAESTSSVPSLEDTVLENDDCNPSEETAWVEEICDWADNCHHAAASKGGWESGVLNDDQVAAYAREPPHSVPLPESWHRWQPRWDRCEGQCPPFNTKKFSSNDWAIYEEHTYLTGRAF
ncbi:hypothetical protein J3R82DRAFT_3523 [Butyriboletus roseoflavus]|nr:hypothetical protein J3R82DRAFT_3523 [Butyriboletus roseoflavus]